MLRGAREQAGAIENQLFAIKARGADRYFFRAANLRVDFGDTQATFRGNLFALGFGDSGIKKHQWHGGGDVERFAVDNQLRGPLRAGDIDDREHQRLADLLRGQANPVLGAHGLNHVGGELADLWSDAFNAFALLAQYGMPIFGDFQNHGLSIAAERGGVKVEEPQASDDTQVSYDRYITSKRVPRIPIGRVYLGSRTKKLRRQ